MDQTSGVIYGILLLVLVGSSLIARRIPMNQMLKMFLIWIGIFIVLFILFSFRAEFTTIWERVKSDFAGTSNQSNNGQEIILTRKDDGHFWIKASVNGQAVDFLVDSGATGIVMSDIDADKAAIDYDTSSIPVIVGTANGNSRNWRAQIDRLETENIIYDNVNILVSPTLGGVNLLGMSYLNRLESWRVEGNRMILKP